MANKTVDLGDRLVGENYPLFTIAEIGINHNGDLQIAKKLLDAAFATGWDCVKFQKRTPDICVPEHQKSLMKDTPWGKMTYLEYRYRVEFDEEQYLYIDKYCKEKPICWTASAWDIPSINFLYKLNVPFIKVPSAKLTEKEFLEYAAKTGKPIILSTGMSTTEEIDEAVNILEKHTWGNYVLMYTNSTYPTNPQDLNLLSVRTLRRRYSCVVGYSGHEYDLEPSVMAATLGASVIERHITLSHDMWGSDQSASLEVHAMDILRKRLRDVKLILGDGVKRLTEKELEVRKKLRGY